MVSIFQVFSTRLTCLVYIVNHQNGKLYVKVDVVGIGMLYIYRLSSISQTYPKIEL